ncbi:MAG: hypothetical protein Q9M89_01650 [Persephonella sp.]|nr:hypothetical protein [Persephonella sp.]
MKQTIYYLSDLKWYNRVTGDTYKSKADVLRAHLNYIEKSKDFVFALSDKKHILERSSLQTKES